MSEEIKTEGKLRDLHILICMPVNGDVKIGCTWSLANAMSHFAALPYDGSKKVGLEICKSSILPEGRTRLVGRATEQGATHIMWVDSDMKFPPDTINRLVNHNLPIVAANYPRKNLEARPTAYADDENYTGTVWSGERASGLQEVIVAGMGVMLTDMRVFDQIALPYFQFTPQPPDYIRQAGEDVFFCKKVADAGLKIYIDHDLSKQCAHVGDFEYTNQLSKEAEVVKQKLYNELSA